MNELQTDLLGLNPPGLVGLLKSWGEPSFRAAQLQKWIYHELEDDFERMTNLPKPLRIRLAEDTSIGCLTPIAAQDSADGLTSKVLFKVKDGQTVETVLMRYADAPNAPELAEGNDSARRTVCISTQVGCPIGCPFCETGQAGFVRNLTAGEIVAQALHFARGQFRAGSTRLPVTNVVIMGMGEPLMKFPVTWQAIEALTDPSRFALGARRVTVSTAGLVPGINELTARHSQVNLAVSLHAPDDELRNRLVPINRRYPLRDLLAACREYVRVTHRRVTFEYALMRDINDSPDQARDVANLLKGLLCHVNLIPLNPTTRAPFQRSPYAQVKAFQEILRTAGIPTTLRVEKGIEIAAGCGQLRQQVEIRRAPHISQLPTAA